jgi:hypothetical protein
MTSMVALHALVLTGLPPAVTVRAPLIFHLIHLSFSTPLCAQLPSLGLVSHARHLEWWSASANMP